MPYAGDISPKVGTRKRPPEKDTAEILANEFNERQQFLLYYVNRVSFEKLASELPHNLEDEHKAFANDMRALCFAGGKCNWTKYSALKDINPSSLIDKFHSCIEVLRAPGVARDLNELIIERTKQNLAGLVQRHFDQLADGFFVCMRDLLVPLANNGHLNDCNAKDDKVSCVLGFGHCKFEISAPTQLAVLKKKAAAVFTISATNGIKWDHTYRPEAISVAINEMSNLIKPPGL